MNPLHMNIAASTLKNRNYRHVIYTTKGFQLVLMSLLPSQEIGMEKHRSTTQFIRIESGTGMAIIDGEYYSLQDDISIVIPPNVYHNIINTSRLPMKLYTIYSGKLQHPDGLVEKIKTE
jgi:mannose-6-phosphate isomerase-like protein (cupin superfamily)